MDIKMAKLDMGCEDEKNRSFKRWHDFALLHVIL